MKETYIWIHLYTHIHLDVNPRWQINAAYEHSIVDEHLSIPPNQHVHINHPMVYVSLAQTLQLRVSALKVK